MKYILKQFVFTFCILCAFDAIAQLPEKISYQAIIRNSNNALVSNSRVSIKLSILQGGENGRKVLEELHHPISNENGLITLEIGAGEAIAGSLSAISWDKGPYFLQTEVDVAGGNNFSLVGISQLLSVPYALYAKTAGSTLPGPSGKDGKSLLSGIIDPISTIGNDSDFYINTTTDFIFGPKANGVWPSGKSLRGSIGATGSAGAKGADGKTILSGTTNPQTADGNDGDFFINTLSDSLFGPKASGVWPSGKSLRGSIGATGSAGAKGADGKTILSGTTNPQTADGNDGDFFINTLSDSLFGPKASGVWPSGKSLRGSIGADGISLMWKGNFGAPPSNPSINWAYYDTNINASLIYTGTKWDTLVKGNNTDNQFIWKGRLAAHPSNPKSQWAYTDTLQNITFIFNGNSWDTLSKSNVNNNIAFSTFNGNRPISAPWVTGGMVNPGTNDIAKWLEAVFYPTQAPTSSLSINLPPAPPAVGGSGSNRIIEFTSLTSINGSLNWQAARQGNTDSITSIVVNGVTQSFVQPAQGSAVSGSINIVFPTNVTPPGTRTNYSMQVISKDGKQASSNASIESQWRRYWGFVTNPVISSSSVITELSQEFATSRLKPQTTTGMPAGSQYFVIAIPAIYDVGTQIFVPQGNATQSFLVRKQTFTLTNLSGGSTQYSIYVSEFPTSSDLTFEIR